VVDATRVRLLASRGTAARRELRQGLVEYITRAGTPDAQAAIELIFSAGLELPADEALLVARVAARARVATRAVTLFPRAIGAGLAGPEDRLAYGLALAQLGRHSEAVSALGRVPAASPADPEATYARAVSLSRLGRRDSALAVLRRLVARHSADTVTVPKGLFLAGELYWRAGDSSAARREWREVVQRAPHHELAGRAGFLAALVLWERGQDTAAAAEWREIHQLNGGADGQAAGYWAGRAYDQQGQTELARGLWLSVMARDSLSYYAVASARRLGVAPWTPEPAADEFEVYPDLNRTGRRLRQLRQLDMTEEVGWERSFLVAESPATPERLLAAAHMLRGDGHASAAVALGRRALRTGARADARTYRLIYPLLHEDELRRQAANAGLDPIVVAALIRQESNWEAQARSRVGALGLMQVMPATGEQIARSLGVRPWTSTLLLDPATNIRFGTHYLAASLRRFGDDLTRALAAYNAGASRVGGWAAGAAADDPELFIERISFTETRDYVRIVQRNLTLYRALYGG